MGTIRDKKLKNEEQRLIVSQDNKLIQKMSTDYDYERNLTKQSFVLDVYQRKMIALLIAHVSPDDEEFRMEKISFANFAKLMNIPKGGKTTELIHSRISRLMGMSFCIEVKPRVFEYYHWIASGCRVDEEENMIYIQLDPGLKNFLIGQKKHFTKYELGYISRLKRKYSCRMYEYMKSVGNLHMLNVRVETLSERITDGVYKEHYDLKRYVIEPSLKEINEAKLIPPVSPTDNYERTTKGVLSSKKTFVMVPEKDYEVLERRNGLKPQAVHGIIKDALQPLRDAIVQLPVVKNLIATIQRLEHEVGEWRKRCRKAEREKEALQKENAELKAEKAVADRVMQTKLNLSPQVIDIMKSQAAQELAREQRDKDDDVLGF